MSATVMAPAEPHDSPAGQPSSAKHSAGRWVSLAQTAASALLLGFALNQRWGYAAGEYDHNVLSPLGMQWARPEWFANDWTVANAPQPHWFFDVFTWLGTTAGSLATAYFLYFAVSMLVYGAATTLLARTWAPQYSWPAVLAVTALSSTAPLYLLGSGAILWPVALPGVLGGLLLYLVCAALLVGRYRLAAIAAICVAIVHVQVGVIATVLLAGVAALGFWRRRKLEPSLILGAAAGGAITYGGLKLRPVAGNIGDFAKICDEIIPYHCNASVWPLKVVIGGIAIMVLSLLTYLYLGKRERTRWAMVLLLPAVGLFGGLVADRFNIPGLGVLAQGTNVYRLAVIFIPFLAWGMLTPLFAQVSPRVRWALLGIVLVLWYLTLRGDDWGLAPSLVRNEHWLFGVIMALVMGCAAKTVPGIVTRPERLQRLAGVVVVLACLSSMSGGLNTFFLRTFEPGLAQRRPELTQWAAKVQEAVPAGSTIVTPPALTDIRMATKRAIVADCKYGPYGGDAFREYVQRMTDLGGIAQCNGRSDDPGYSALTTDQLEATAKKYGANYIMLVRRQGWANYQLRQRGWTVIVPQPDPTDFPSAERDRQLYVSILRAPWA